MHTLYMHGRLSENGLLSNSFELELIQHLKEQHIFREVTKQQQKEF